MLDGADRFAVPDPRALALVERAQVGVLGAHCRHRCVLERGVQPARAFAGASGALLAGRSVVAGALPGPRREVPGAGEDAHVRADLGDDHFGGAPLNTRDAAQQLNGRVERGDALLDRVRQPVDLLIEEVQVREDRADQQRVQIVEAALQGFPKRGDLLTQAPLREIGEHLGISRAGHERVEHRPAGLAQQVRRDAVQLDVGVLQRLVQPLRLALALSDLRLAIPGELPQVADRLWRHEVGLQQPRLGKLTQPRRVAHVGLAARDLLDVTGIDEHQLEVVLEDVPDRLPIHPGRLHDDLRHAVRRQPIAQRQQPPHRRWNSARCGSRPPPAAGTRTHAVTLALWTSSAPNVRRSRPSQPPRVDDEVAVREGP